MSTQKDKEIIQARVDQAVAEDVAVGMAAKATEEQIRADALAASNIQKSARLEQVRAQRDAAAVTGAVARSDARSASFGFWLLLGLVGVGLLIGAIWFATRPEPSTTTTVINRTPVPAAGAPAAKAPVAAVPIPSQQTAPAAPPPVIIERERPVAVPVPVPVPAERPAPPAQQQQQPEQTIILEPARPAPSGEASEGTTTGESGAAAPTGSATGETPGTGSSGG